MEDLQLNLNGMCFADILDISSKGIPCFCRVIAIILSSTSCGMFIQRANPVTNVMEWVYCADDDDNDEDDHTKHEIARYFLIEILCLPIMSLPMSFSVLLA